MMKEQICQTALGLFIQDGLRRITMDDLALELGISKKTIYQYFSSKEELIGQCVKEVNRMVLVYLKFLKKSRLLAIKELLEIRQCLEIFTAFSFSSIINEHSRFYYKIESKQKKFLTQKVSPYLEANLEKGIQEGVFKQDLDVECCSWSFISLITSKLPSEYDHDTLKESIVDFYFKAITTEQGSDEFRLLSKDYLEEVNFDDLLKVI